MFVITYEERKIVEDELYRNIEQNPKFSLAAYKLFYNLLKHRNSLSDTIQLHLPSPENHNINSEQLADAFAPLLQLVFECAAETDSPLLYTTGQIAAIFGVSTTTVNNWLRDKRIVYSGADDRPSFKQSRIPDTAIYRSTNGKETLLREVIQEYEYKKAKEPPYDEVERVKNLVQTLILFESKYGGKYEEAVTRLGDPQSSEDWTWTRDADEWRYVMREIAGER